MKTINIIGMILGIVSGGFMIYLYDWKLSTLMSLFILANNLSNYQEKK